VTVVVHDLGAVTEQRTVLSDLMGPVVRAFDDAATLGGTTFGVRFGEGTEGTIRYNDKTYIGFTVTASVKEKITRQLSG
jgi:hypothetical protein